MAECTSRGRHLKLVKSADASPLSEALKEGEVRDDIERLIEVLIEMVDLVDGDPDAEPNGDEFEDDDDI